MDKTVMSRRHSRSREISRRAFLGAGAAGGAALLTGGLSSLARGALGPQQWILGEQESWLGASIPQLQSLMDKGKLTSRDLTYGYLQRIKELNPLLHAVIETNPRAVSIATQLDQERRRGHVRGPLHGIPVLVKDNIAIDDTMETTAGSLALVKSRVPEDAGVVKRLREAGAVILGKANLSEWANFRGFAPFNGWSARGGFTRDPYLLNIDPSGSSSGSAVASAAYLCAAAVGTETDGSIVVPSGINLIVGLKPTVGLVSQDGIIPIAHSQDTAGPMGRTVTDIAILLGALQSPFGAVKRRKLPDDYTKFLKKHALKGARIGVDWHFFYDTSPDYWAFPEQSAVVVDALHTMEDLGAEIVEILLASPTVFYNDEFSVLLYEFKVDIADYLEGLHHTSMRTLDDLIQFDKDHCPEEMKYFGQEIFEMADATSGDLTDPIYLEARANCLKKARDEGIDKALKDYNLDAIVIPSYNWSSSYAAVAGYPNLSLPVGFDVNGWPAGMCLFSGFLQEPRLLALAYDLEQELKARTTPQFLGAVPGEPADAGICAVMPQAQTSGAEKIQRMRRLFTGRPGLW
jgi:amidase